MEPKKQAAPATKPSASTALAANPNNVIHKPVEIPKGVTHKDMVGKTVTIHLKDRLEQTFTGHLTALNEYGAVTTGVLRGRKPYVDLVPWHEVSFITCSLAGDDDDDAED